jgi:hypothetical protein
MELRFAPGKRLMKTIDQRRTERPLGSYEFGTLMLLALFVAPLALHLLAGLTQ